MSEMGEGDHFGLNLGAALLQLGLAEDCEEAMNMICQHLPNLSVPQTETRYVFVQKNDLASKILNEQPVKLEKYRVEYQCKDAVKSAIVDE